jgi:hypothetical protein
MNNSPTTNRMDNVIASSARLSLNRTQKVLAAILWSSVLTFGIQTSRAGSATWKSNPATSNWNTASNWTPGTVPNNSADTATFGSSSINNVSISANTEVNSLAFSIGGSTAYNISASPTFILKLSGAGIINNSGVTQTFITASDSNGSIRFSNNATAGSLTAFTNVGVTQFLDSSTAGNGIFVNKGGATSNTLGGYIAFGGSSTAGNGNFTNEGGAVIGAGGATIDFYDNSTAGNATFRTNSGGSINFYGNSSADSGTFIMDGCSTSGAYGGSMVFYYGSTAANGTFTINGGTASGAEGGYIYFASGTADNGTFIANGGTTNGASGGVLEFAYFSGTPPSIGNATLIANGGVNGGDGGTIQFRFEVFGGTARVKIFGNGKLIVGDDDPELAIGSLEGDGNVHLGTSLNVGSNNLSTTFSGVIQYSSSLIKTGTGTLTLSGNNFNPANYGETDIREGRLLVNNTSGSGTGAGPVIVHSGAVLGGNGTIELGQDASLTNNGTIAPGSSAGRLNVDGDIELNYSSTLSCEIGGTTPATQYDVLNKIDAGALTLKGKLTVTLINGFTPQPADTFTVVTTETTLGGAFTNVKSGGRMNTAEGTGSFQVTYSGANNVVLSNFGPPLSPSRSQNISTRANVQTGDDVAIGGFIINGSGTKKVIIRGVGPSLQTFGIQNPLPDPTLELHGQSGVIASNNNWKDTQQTEIQNTGLAPGDELESAIVATLQPGAYSVILRGQNNGTGIGLVEVFDIDPAANSKLANISTRGLVGTNDDVMIGGIIVGPNNGNSRTVLLRAIGPSLQPFGIQDFLADPTLELHDAQGNLFAFNDNWKNTQQVDITTTGLSPSNDAESAILVTLVTGNWTAIVRGVGGTSGVALIEVYDLQ